MNPLVSVIATDGASVQGQSYDRFELVKSLAQASGDIVVFLSPGDRLRPNYLATMANMWGEGYRCGFAQVIDNSGDSPRVVPIGPKRIADVVTWPRLCGFMARHMAHRYGSWKQVVQNERYGFRSIVVGESVEARNVIARPTPKVSVVLPAYNAERYIRECLDSILTQSFTDFELILVNDGSTDSTGRILDLAALSDDRVHTVIHKPNGGTGSALNAGFAQARGRYLTWWSADSYVSPDWLDAMVTALDAATPNVGFVYSDWAIHRELDGTVQIETTPEFDRIRLQRECYIGPCWLFRRELKESAGDYSTELCEDYAMHLRMASLTEFKRVPKVLGYWRDHSENLTSTKSVPDEWRQSYRAQAREKWATAKCKIAYVCPNIDAAGVGWWLTRAINELLPDVAARHVIWSQTAIKQLDDLQFGVHEHDAEIRRVLDECDVIHCNQVLPKFGTVDLLPWLDNRKKRLILHLHGGHWVWDVDRIRACSAKYNALVLTCAPSYRRVLPGAVWMPNYIPVGHSPLFEPATSWPTAGPKLRVLCHHNYESGKSLDLIAETIRILGSDYGVHLDASVGAKSMPIRQHLQHKKQYDVVIDQITQGFVGMASWESLAQGAVVIARLDQDAIDAYTRVFGSVPPIVNVCWIDELAIELGALSHDPDRVVRCKKASRQWALECYSSERILSLWGALYQSVVAC